MCNKLGSEKLLVPEMIENYLESISLDLKEDRIKEALKKYGEMSLKIGKYNAMIYEDMVPDFAEVMAKILQQTHASISPEHDA